MDMSTKSPTLDNMTSTGSKFWLHPLQMESYRRGGGHTVITTHISPEGACNLDCDYCSVSKRDVHQRLDLGTIKNYLRILGNHGLKAVILTGGGEPTGYKHFNELVEHIYSEGFKVALITNGTLAKRVDVWDYFSWVRVSINNFPSWQEKIWIPDITGRVGLSYCYYTEENIWADIQKKADQLDAEYIRVLPDCTLPQDQLIEWHEKLDKVLPNDERFIHQPKLHETPKTSTCHQSFFRPYLHESGVVYPCDSVVLNDSPGAFKIKYALCESQDIGLYLQRKIPQQFDAMKDCSGCVFTKTINMLEDYVNGIQDPDFV